MEALANIESTEMKTLGPAILVQVSRDVVIRIDQLGVVRRTSLDVLLSLILGSLVVPKLEIRRSRRLLSCLVLRQNGEISRILSRLVPM